MSDRNFSSQNANVFKEAVCVNAGRIYDSCSDKDCLEDLQCYFTTADSSLVNNAISVKAKKVSVLNVLMDVEPVPFNKGFYSVDMTFYFLVKLEVCPHCSNIYTPVEGLCVFNKKVILYGSEGNVKTFSSKDFCNQTSIEDYCQEEVPQANVTVAPPIILACNICDCNPCNNAPLINVPSCVANKFRGEFSCEPPHKAVCLTIGLFSIVSLERNVQMLIPVYEYCLPDKECVTTTDDPCELFKRIKFPVNDFFPPRLEEVDDDCGC